MAQPDISQILAALGRSHCLDVHPVAPLLTAFTAQQTQNGTPQTSATPQQHHQHQLQQQPPPGMYGGLGAAQSPPIGAGYLPQPSSTGSVDLSAIHPSSSGSVSIADAIAKAKSIAADRGVNSYDPRLGTSRDHQQRTGHGFHSRSRSRSPARRDNYSNPYRDERRAEPRRGGHRRSPSAERNFRGAKDPPPGYRANDGETETIRVKSSLVGLIIGRNGENLRKVEGDTGARVQFIQAKDSHASERQCTISGALRAREDAKAAIFSIIEENGGSNIMNEKGAYTAGMPGRAKVNLPALREGENSTQILVPDKTVGLIIGRGGETIKDVQEKSGCHVNIVGENKSINGLRPINLIGTDQATRVAKDLILEIVESDSRGTATATAAGSGAGSGPNSVPAARDRGFDQSGGREAGRDDAGGDGYEEKTIKVPSEAVGMIIGKGGETIKDLQRTSGCKINVNQPKQPDVTRNIDLAGTRRSLQQAERVIWEKVKTVRERDAAAGRGSAAAEPGAGYDSGAQRYDGYSQQQQQAAPSLTGYGQYTAQQAPTAMPAFQMPYQQQSTPAQGAQQQGASDPTQTEAYQAFYAQWYAQQMAALANQGAPPGTQ